MGAQPSSRSEGTVPGGWLPLSHLEALREVPGLYVVALSDVDAEALTRWGAHYAIDRLYPDFRALIDEVRPEILTVATRTPAKESIIRYACERGVKGLYVEKPLATSLVLTRSLLAQVAASDVKLAYGVNRRYHAVYREARRLLIDGAIGDVIDIVVEHGRSRLLWTHPHTMDVLLFFAGTDEVRSVQARADDDSVLRTAELVVDSDPVVESAVIEFANGIRGVVSRGSGLSVRLSGTRGALIVHANGSHLQISRAQHPASPYYDVHEFVHPPAPVSATVTALRELAAAVVDRSEPGIAPATIYSGTAMLLGCVWSHLNGGAHIRVADIPPEFAVTGRSGTLYA